MPYAQDFGAAADGTTDDTEALQHALDEGDGVLKLAKGTYRITRPLLLDATKLGYVSVRGEGGTSRLVMEGAGPALRIVGDHRGTAQPDSVKPHTWEKERFPIVSGLEILGKHPEADGIELRKTMQTTISNVLVRNCRVAIHLVERNRNFLLADSHIYDNSLYGVFFDKCNLHQINICGNHISYNRRAGIKSLDGDVHNLQITGNDIEYNNRPGIDTPEEGGAEIDFEAPEGVISEVTIASNTIQATIQPGGANVRIRGPQTDSGHGARLIAITGNVLGSQTRGIEMHYAQRVAISGNTIYSSQDRSILAEACSGFSIVGNTISWRGTAEKPKIDGILLDGCDSGVISGMVCEALGAGDEDAGGGIHLRGCRDVAVSESQILDALVRGVELEDCVRCRVSGNSIVDRREQPTMLEGVRVRGMSRGNLVQNNMLGGAVREGVVAEEGMAVLQGNVEV